MADRTQRSISRELWSESDVSTSALWRAVLYELQPIRFRQIQMRRWFSHALSILKVCWTSSIRIVNAVYMWIMKDFSLWHAKLLAGLAIYYIVVRVVNAYLDAGPLMLMVTALVVIFTVGLADNDEKDPRRRRELSAYHVFNRGMQRMMGDLDADELLAQHVGGFFYNGNRNDDDDDFRAHRPRQQQVDADRQHQPEDGNDEAAAQPGTARKSRKKARGQQRRERQRERDAAAMEAMDGLEGEDAIAMQRHLEEQIRLEHNQ